MEQESSLLHITPAEAGIPAKAVIGFLDQIREKEVHLHSFMMLKGDKVFAEGSYAPCKKGDIHMLFSLSKSITSMAVGFAVQEQRMSVEDPVLDFFREEPQLIQDADENMKKMRIRHLLTMNTGHVDPMDDTFKDMTADWGRDFLQGKVEREPGSWFLYNTRASCMLALIVQKVTGETLLQYLTPRLFAPMGFGSGLWWEHSPQGYDAGGFGLNMTVEDIAKFGILLLNKGMFQGKRILRESWFEDAFRPWSDTSVTWSGENLYGYGYQFWMCHVPESFRADGAYGQYCVVLPRENMIFAATAGELDMQRILDAYWENIYAATGKGIQEGEAKWEQALRERLSGLTLPVFYEENGQGNNTIMLPEAVYGKKYEVDHNVLQITGIRFLKEEDNGTGCRVELQNGSHTDIFRMDAQRWEEGRLRIDGEYTALDKGVFRTGLFEHFYCKGRTEKNTLYFDMIFPETAYQDTWKVEFLHEKINLHVKRNAGFDVIDFQVPGYSRG